MAELLRIGDPPILIPVRRRKNARRLTLRISGDGPIVTIPKRTPLRDAQDFIARKENWLREKLVAQPEKINVSDTQSILISGALVPIAPANVRACKLFDETLQVPVSTAGRATKIATFLKMRARVELTQASTHYAEKLGRPFEKITLRDTRSRWGSCTSSGNLMYSWRLIMAPRQVLHYVAAHEVAHLEEMNHSDRFWARVADLMPDYHNHRHWLRENGAKLHRYDFEA